MFNRGLLYKTVRETRMSILLFGLGLFVFETVVAYALPQFAADIMDHVDKFPFIKKIIGALTGSAMADQIGPKALTALPWVHPIALALIWGHEILFCTRLPAAEVDRGTVDVLLGLPISRWRAYLSESLVWIGSGVVILSLAVVGNRLGTSWVEGGDTIPMHRVVVLVSNLFCLYVAVGGLCYLISSFSDRRGRAVGTTFAIVLASFFVNFLTQFWEPARSVAFLGLLNYYQPISIVDNPGWPVSDMLVLLGFGGVAWICGGLRFARRDICTL